MVFYFIFSAKSFIFFYARKIFWWICESKLFFKILVFFLFWLSFNRCITVAFYLYIFECDFVFLFFSPLFFLLKLSRHVIAVIMNPLGIRFVSNFERLLCFFRRLFVFEKTRVKYNFLGVHTYSWRSVKKRPSRVWALEELNPESLFFFLSAKCADKKKGPFSVTRSFLLDLRKNFTQDWYVYENARIEFLVLERIERERLRLLNAISALKRDFGTLWPKFRPIGAKLKAKLIKFYEKGKLINHLANTNTVKGFHYWKDRHTLGVLLIPGIIYFWAQWYNDSFLNWGAWVMFWVIVWYMFWQDWIFSGEKWFAAFCIWSTLANFYLWLPFTG